MMNSKLQSGIAALAAVLGMAACSNGGADGSRFAAPTGPLADGIFAQVAPQTATLCKDGPAGTYSFTVSAGGSANAGDQVVSSPSITVVTPGTPVCTTVFTRTQYAGGTSDPAALITIIESAAAGTHLLDITTTGSDASTPDVQVGNRKVTVGVNAFHSATATFINEADAPPPPEAVCDFITFGRLVTTVNGKKVVISGNIGGNQPGGGILSEFHVEANGVDNHVANVDTYGPITSGPLSGPNFPNARMSTGTAKNGVAVEVRMWDGGEPGKGTDVVYVTLNGALLLGPQYIDQGNMQYHSNCRGPKS